MGKWFWLTLKGYKVTIATPTKFYHVKHRPFRQPQMWSSLMNPRSQRYTSIVFDEASDIDPELLDRVIDLAANDPDTSNNGHKSAPVRRLKGE